MKIFTVIIFLMIVSGCSSVTKHKSRQQTSTTHLIPSSFDELHDWNTDMHEKPFIAFTQSCKRIMKKKQSSNKLGDDVYQWQQVCKNALNLSNSFGNINELQGTKLAQARLLSKKFFEKYFRPYKVGMSDHSRSLSFNARFTGYYEMELQGTRKKNAKFPYPLYGLPKDRQKGCQYFTRKEINAGALKGKNLEIAWVNDMPRLYFLHIQGNGVIKLREGGEIPLVWAGTNGYKFSPLPAKYLGSTTQVMKQLRNKGQEGMHDMNLNKSYVFFKHRKEAFPVGAQVVMLTPERSAAIDSRIYPYGVPIWMEAKLPFIKGFSKGEKYYRLLIAQDRGGAIQGGGRLDLFWGRGRRAESISSGFNSLGNMYVLFPKNIIIPKTFEIN